MKIALKILLIIIFLFLPALTFAASHTYHVTQNGSGDRSGKSLLNAWSVSDFNSASNWSTTDHTNKIDPGDSVKFYGTITSQIEPKGSGTNDNYITLDGDSSTVIVWRIPWKEPLDQ